MTPVESAIAVALKRGDDGVASAMFQAFAEAWTATGDIRHAWIACYQIARRLTSARVGDNFPAFARVMAGSDAPAKEIVIRALVGSLEMTPDGLQRTETVGMDFAEGMAGAILRMRGFQAGLSAPAQPLVKPQDAAAAALPEVGDMNDGD